jgi:hypothetical protein
MRGSRFQVCYDLPLSETNLDWNRPYVKSEYLSRQQKIWKHSATSFSTIDMESSSDYMTVGTLTATVNKWSSSLQEGCRSIWDGTVELSNPSG